MREIRFRAWDRVKKTMFYDIQKSVYCHYTYGFTGKQYGTCIHFDAYFIDKFIIMQYTGLKDKNGKEIYEGDVVKILDYDWLRVVCWNEYQALFVFCDLDSYKNGTRDGGIINEPGDNSLLCETDVIGNIYENSSFWGIKND